MNKKTLAIGLCIVIAGVVILFLAIGQHGKEHESVTTSAGVASPATGANAHSSNKTDANDYAGQIDELNEELFRMAAKDLEEASYKIVLRNPVLYAATGGVRPLHYAEARELFGPDGLPKMYACLADPKCKGEWRYIAQLIGMTSERGDSKSVEALYEYMKRPDVWSHVETDRRASYDVGMGKALCLEWMGMIGGQEAEAILSVVVTEEGSRECAEQWLQHADVSYPGGSKSLLASLRGRAAMGLVYCQTATGNSIVEQMYADERAKCVDAGIITSRLFDELVSAKAYKAFIADHGLRSCFELYGDPDYLEKSVDYIREYQIHEDADR